MNNIIHTIRWRLAWYRRRINLPHPPEYINLEPTNACNLSCTVCSLDRTLPTGMMDVSLAQAILNDAAEFGVREVRFFLAGEPVLHKHLPKMVKIAADLGLRTVIHTNATRLNPDLNHELIQSGLHEISFSFDGQDAESYQAVQQGANYQDTLNRILEFLNTKKSLGGRTPYSVLQVIQVSGDASNGLRSEFKRHFEGLPLDRFRLLAPFTWPRQEAEGFIPRIGSKYFPCQALWQSVSIGWDGTFLGCCGDLNHLWKIGMFPDKKIRDVWNGPEMTEARKRLTDKKPKDLPLCSQCSAVWRNHHPFWSDLRDAASWLKRKMGSQP